MGTVSHFWTKHMKPYATKLFFTKKQSDARYYKKADSDSRYYTKADADLRYALKGETADSDLLAYCAAARAHPSSYPAEPCEAALVVTVDSAGDVGAFTSLALGADGLPVVSYRDATNGDLKVLHCGNESCTAGNEAVTVDSAGNVGAHTALAIGADGLPVIAYQDVANADLKVAHCGDVTCSAGNTVTPVDAGLVFVGSDVSLAIGSDGLPVVSYVDVSNGDLKVLHCGNAACSAGNGTTAVDPGPVGADVDTSIALGTDGRPLVTYYDFDDGDLRILRCGDAACSSSNVSVPVDVDFWVGEFSSLAIGVDGFPVVSYRDGTNGDLKVLHCGNAACSAGNVATAVDTSADPLGYDTSIAIGVDGFPVVSYYDGSANDLKVLVCGSADCTSGNTTLSLDTAGTVGRHTSLAIGTDGRPLVSYYDETNGDLKVARPPVP
jgi:hypothetical protein